MNFQRHNVLFSCLAALHENLTEFDKALAFLFRKQNYQPSAKSAATVCYMAIQRCSFAAPLQAICDTVFTSFPLIVFFRPIAFRRDFMVIYYYQLSGFGISYGSAMGYIIAAQVRKNQK